MALEDARRFVVRMRESREFREQAAHGSGPEALRDFLRREGMSFDQQELVGAMAECMEQMEQQVRQVPE